MHSRLARPLELPPEESLAKNSGREAAKRRRSRGRGAMSGTLGPTRCDGERGRRGRRRPPGRRSPSYHHVATDEDASFPSSVRVAPLSGMS